MSEAFPNPVFGAVFIAMKNKGISIPNVEVKDGKVIIKPPRMSVSQKIRQKHCKKVKPTKRIKGSFNKP